MTLPRHLIGFAEALRTEGVAIGSRGFLRRALEGGADPIANVDVDALRPLPADAAGSSAGGGGWFSLSRLRRMGVG